MWCFGNGTWWLGSVCLETVYKARIIDHCILGVVCESSHDRSAAKCSELLTCGVQYLTRHMPSNEFVRATGPTFLRACTKPNILEILSYYPGIPHVRSSTAQKHLSQKVQPLPWDGNPYLHDRRANKTCTTRKRLQNHTHRNPSLKLLCVLFSYSMLCLLLGRR